MEVECFELADRPCGQVDGVHAEMRHRAVRRHTFEARMELERALVAYERIVRRRLAHDQRACCSQKICPFCEVPGADAAGLFGRGKDDHHPGRARELACHAARREKNCCYTGLHVG
jgi:hypothetical protein